MISTMEKQQIAEYVLDPANSSRLDLAISIVESYEEIKRRIIFEFTERLEARLKERFPAFIIEVGLKEYSSYKYAGVVITKSAWLDTVIAISAQSLGARNFYIGVAKDQSRTRRPCLFAALNNGYMTGKNNYDSWEWYRTLDGFKNWDNETLIKLCNHKSLESIVEQLDRICAIAEPIIDGEMR